MVTYSIKDLIKGYLLAAKSGDESKLKFFDDAIYKFVEACTSVEALRFVYNEGLSKRVLDLINCMINIYELAAKRAETIANQSVDNLNEEKIQKLATQQITEEIKKLSEAQLKELAKKRIKQLAETHIVELVKVNEVSDENISTFIESQDVNKLESLRHLMPKKGTLSKP